MAANQVTVSTPGPAGATGLTYEGLWVSGSVYQVRDLVRFTDGNLYFCNVQHTAASGNTPVLDSTTWTLFINADDAFQWATKAKHTSITDSLGNTGYSALHQSAKAQDWASLTTDAVTNDANASDVDYSAKAWAIGGTEVTTTAARGAAKEWATKTNAAVDTSEFSAKAYAVGGTGVTTSSGKGAAKEWATTTGGLVDTAEYSAKEYAQGAVLAAGGSAKNWAQLATTPSTTATDASAKEWAIGTATHKNDGSAKEWAVYTSGDVRGGSAGDMSSKEWAVGIQGRGVSGEGSSKDWATRTGATVDDSEYSAKEYALGTTVAVGSAKDWAVLAEDSAVTGSSYSALHHAAKAAASATAGASSATASASSATASASSATAAAASETAANASADAVSVLYDAFNDTYLGAMADNASQGTNPTPTGTWAKNSSTITVSAGTNIKVGQVVTGTGMPTSPKPNVISVSGTTVVLSDNMAAAGSGVTLTFTGYGIYGDFNGTKDGPALNNDGDALADGMLYFNTTDDVVKVYDETTSTWKQIQPTSTEQGHINTVSGIQANVTTVAGISANVTTVAGIHANVTTVATNNANVTTVATNIANVNNFAALYQIDDFSPSAPSTDGSGASLADGDLAYDTTANRLKVYESSAFTNIGLTTAETQTEANNAAVAMSIALG